MFKTKYNLSCFMDLCFSQFSLQNVIGILSHQAFPFYSNAFIKS